MKRNNGLHKTEQTERRARGKGAKAFAALLGLSLCALLGFTACAAAPGEGVYKFNASQIVNVNFDLPEEEAETIVANFDAGFDPLDDTENEHNVISDKRFAEILEVVKQRAYDFTYEYYTLNENLTLNPFWSRIRAFYYKDSLYYNRPPIHDFNAYLYENFSDCIDASEKLSEAMLLKIKFTFEEVYLSNAEPIIKANFIFLEDFSEAEQEELLNFLYEECKTSVNFYCKIEDYFFKQNKKAFSFKTYNMSYYSSFFFLGGEKLTINEILDRKYNEKLWMYDYERLEEPIKKFWLEIADQEFLKRYGYKYTDCMKLTDPDYKYNFVGDY